MVDHEHSSPPSTDTDPYYVPGQRPSNEDAAAPATPDQAAEDRRAKANGVPTPEVLEIIREGVKSASAKLRKKLHFREESDNGSEDSTQ